MAVGYHKLNTSSARAKRVNKKEIPRNEIVVISSGANIWSATFGDGVTMDAFVSDCDNVQCKFTDGMVVLRGSAVRMMIHDAIRRK